MLRWKLQKACKDISLQPRHPLSSQPSDAPSHHLGHRPKSAKPDRSHLAAPDVPQRSKSVQEERRDSPEHGDAKTGLRVNNHLVVIDPGEYDGLTHGDRLIHMFEDESSFHSGHLFLAAGKAGESVHFLVERQEKNSHLQAKRTKHSNEGTRGKKRSSSSLSMNDQSRVTYQGDEMEQQQEEEKEEDPRKKGVTKQELVLYPPAENRKFWNLNYLAESLSKLKGEQLTAVGSSQSSANPVDKGVSKDEIHGMEGAGCLEQGLTVVQLRDDVCQ